MKQRELKRQPVFHPGPCPSGPALLPRPPLEWPPVWDMAADAASAGAGRLSVGSCRWPRPNPGACDPVTLHSKGNFAEAVTTVAMGTVPWITWLGPRFPQGSLEEEGKKARGRSRCEDGRRGRSDAAVSQGSRSPRESRQGKEAVSQESPQESPQERPQPGFSPRRPAVNFRSPGRKDDCAVLSHEACGGPSQQQGTNADPSSALPRLLRAYSAARTRLQLLEKYRCRIGAEGR